METIVRTIMPDRGFLGHVFKLALPIAFQQLMLSLSSCADTLMLSGVGQNELAAVSLVFLFHHLTNNRINLHRISMFFYTLQI